MNQQSMQQAMMANQGMHQGMPQAGIATQNSIRQRLASVYQNYQPTLPWHTTVQPNVRVDGVMQL